MDDAQRLRLMHQGFVAFNEGRFFDAHEHWEDVWNEIDEPQRRWVQAMIQIATGLHKLHQGKLGPCRTLLEKALAKLVDAQPILDGYDLAGLAASARQTLDAVARGGAPDPLLVKLFRAG